MTPSWEPWIVGSARRWPHAEAYVDRSCTLANVTLRDAGEALARGLITLGLRPGERVATLVRPSPRFVALLHAAQLARLTLVPLNDRLQAHELARLVAHATPHVLLHDDATAALARVARNGDERTRLVDVTTLDSTTPATGDLPEPRPDDVLAIVYTSGTTAAPKGVLLSNANLEAGARASIARLGCRAGERWLAAMPLCHVGGLAILVRAAIGGLTVVQQPRFSASEVDRALRTDEIAFVSLVPTMLAMLLDASEATPYPATLRAVVLGGGRLPATLVARAAERRIPLVATYGMTETAAQATTSHPGDAVAHPGSAGHPIAGVELTIDGADADGVGEILVRAAQVCSGYHDSPDTTARALRDGWLHTGDLGRLDAERRLWVESRRTDRIVTGGENVHPEEVEEVLTAHPSVLDAGVYALDDERWGQRVAAAVVASNGAPLDAEALTGWCRERLAPYKVPRRIIAVTSLPRTTSGKLQRHLLATVAVTGSGTPRDPVAE